MAVVEFQDVTKLYHMGESTIAAADGITFSAEQGEFVIIVGRTAAPATTVLNAPAGWIPAPAVPLCLIPKGSAAIPRAS